MYQCSKKLVTAVLTILIFRHIQYLHLMYAEIAWVLVSIFPFFMTYALATMLQSKYMFST